MDRLVTWERLGLAGYGLALTIIGTQLDPPWMYAELLDWAPRLWQTLVTAAGLLTLGWATAPRSRWLYVTSYLTVATATASRSMALLWITGDLVPAAAWGGLFAAALTMWRLIWSDAHRGE